MKNHFFYPYFGNKRQEVEKIYNEIENIDSYTHIIEPYCGSCALSFYIWMNDKDKNKTYILNDNDEKLIELFTISKDKTKFDKLCDDLDALHLTITNKDEYQKVVSKSDLVSWIYIRKVCSFRIGLYPTNKKFNVDCFKNFRNAPIIDFFRNANIIISNKDGMEVYNEYKANPKALLFLDPPYLICDNNWYSKTNINIYEYLSENDISKEKALILLCLENIWIIKLLFKGKKHILYDKKYETTKKKTEHILVMNK